MDVAVADGRVAASNLIITADHWLNAPARDLWPALFGGPVTVRLVDADHDAFLRPWLASMVPAATRRQARTEQPPSPDRPNRPDGATSATSTGFGGDK
jgi:hypothetical protein